MVKPTRALFSCLLLAACAPVDARSHVQRGNICLNERRAAEALGHFDEALRGLKPHEQELRLDASFGKCEALASLDPPRCAKEFLRLGQRVELDPSDYNQIAVALYNEANFEQALDILEQGQAQFPGKNHFAELIEKVGDALVASRESNEANDAMNEAVARRLKNLGYLGNDERKR